MRRFWLLWSGVMIAVAAVASAANDTLFVIDQLVISVRKAPADNAAPLESLRSGQKVQILADEGRFFKVQLGDGRQGYVLKQYLTAEAPRATQLAKLEQERDALRTQLAAAEEQAKAAAALPAAGDGELQQTRQELAEAKAQLAGVPQNDEKLLLLRRELEQSRSETARLEAEVTALKEEDSLRFASGMIPWFLAGGGVLLVGWMMGRSARQKRRF